MAAKRVKSLERWLHLYNTARFRRAVLTRDDLREAFEGNNAPEDVANHNDALAAEMAANAEPVLA